MKDGFGGSSSWRRVYWCIRRWVVRLISLTGIPTDIAAAWGPPVKDFFWVVIIAGLFISSVRFQIYFELLGAGAQPVGMALRDQFEVLRANLVATATPRTPTRDG